MLHFPKLQPTTIGGLAILTATFVGLLSQYLTGGTTQALMLAGIAAGLVKIVLPDSTVDTGLVSRIMTDALRAVSTGNLVAAAPALLRDVTDVVSALEVRPAPGQATIVEPAAPMAGGVSAGAGTVVCALLAVLALAACTPSGTVVAPKSPDQALYETKVAFDVAVKQAVAYAGLPRCGPAAPPVCSDLATIKRLDDAAQKGNGALAQARVLLAAYRMMAAPTASDLDRVTNGIAAALSATKALSALLPAGK